MPGGGPHPLGQGIGRQALAGFAAACLWEVYVALIALLAGQTHPAPAAAGNARLALGEPGRGGSTQTSNVSLSFHSLSRAT